MGEIDWVGIGTECECVGEVVFGALILGVYLVKITISARKLLNSYMYLGFSVELNPFNSYANSPIDTYFIVSKFPIVANQY